MKHTILLVIFALFATTASSQVRSNSDLKNTKAISKELGKVDGYLLHLPPGYNNSTKKYPLIVYLHGTGERGNGTSDLYKIAKVGAPSRRAEEDGSLCFKVNGVEQCFIVISPQLNMGNNWTAANQEPFWDYILNKSGYRIDKDRVYITGHSLGGNGVWEAAYSEHNSPNRFAAMVPLSYWSTTSKVCKVADRKIPVWGLCGERDSRFIGKSQAAISTLKNCQRDKSVEIKFTVVPKGGHGITGPTYRTDHSMYKPNIYEWLLSKKRGSGSSTPSAPDAPEDLEATAQSSTSIKISWDEDDSEADGFTIQRSTNSGSGFTTVGTVGADKESYTDNGLTPSTKYYYKVRAFNDGGNSAFTNPVSATTHAAPSGGGASSSGGSAITWTKIRGAVQKGADLESTASYGWGNSGAESKQSIASNTDGWIEMVIEDASKADLVFGLSDANVNDNVESIDYGFELSRYNGAFWARENSDRTYLGKYKIGDKLRIERSGNKILYKKNGQVISTSSVSSRPGLIADVSLLNSGSTVFNGRISSSTSNSEEGESGSGGSDDGFIKWTKINGAVQKGADLESTASYGWGNSGAQSTRSIPSNTDGWIEFVVQDASKSDLVCGLSDANANDNKESIDHGFELSRYNGAFWMRENTNRTYLGKYKEGDKLRVERSGNKILYKQNGKTIATSNVSPKPTLVADAALLNTGSTVCGGKISSSSSSGNQSSGSQSSGYVSWVNVKGAVQKGENLESTASYGWGNSGAESRQSIASNMDGWVEMVIEDPSKADLVFGLSDDNVNDKVESIDYGFELSKYNNAYWTRENSDRRYLGKYQKGDKLRIERSGNRILYKRNGETISSTNVSSKPELVADVALLNTGATVYQARISSGGSGSRMASEANTELADEQEVLVYPNPIGDQGRIRIDLEGYEQDSETRFMIYDLSGMLVVDEPIDSPSTELMLQNLSQSMYTYKLVLNGKPLKSGLLKR